MNGPIVIITALALTMAGIIEYAAHKRRLSSFRIRVDVNGTRGKSTVTRLIAAGLSAGGIKTAAKTTGTLPRLVLPDGTEEPIRRRGKARISEQLWVAKRAASAGAEALVVECMALEAENQRVYEHMLVRSTIGVITNIRPDHLDVMGPTVNDVARTLAITIPKNADLVTADASFEGYLREECRKKKTTFHLAEPNQVSKAELEMFRYTSFADNVAVALKACEIAGVDRNTALRGMLTAKPDPGVSPVSDITVDGRSMRVVNAFAANDVESTMRMWNDFARPALETAGNLIVVVNNREDRPQRVREMSHLASSLPARKIFYVGKLQNLAVRLTPQGAPPVTALRTASPEEALRVIAHEIPEGSEAVLFLIGNTKGMGGSLTERISSLASSDRRI